MTIEKNKTKITVVRTSCYVEITIEGAIEVNL